MPTHSDPLPLPQLTPPPDTTPHPAQSDPFFLDQIDAMKRHLQNARDLPGLERLRETAELPAAFFEHFDAALACFDRIIDFVLRFDGTQSKVQCSKGCCNCCIDLVRGVTTPEIVNIYNHVRNWPDVRQIFEYHRESAELFMGILASKLEPDEQSFGGRDQRVAQAHVEYNLLNRPCGFLDTESGQCRIYPVRPIACRYFFSLDPPEYCTPGHEKYLSRDTRTIHLPDEVNKLLIELARRFDFKTLSYLSGAFCSFASDVMRTRPIKSVASPDEARDAGG